MEIGKSAYEQFVDYWAKPSVEELIGSHSDVGFLSHTDWLEEAVVIDHIRFSEGRWHISLILVHPNESNVFIVQRMSSHETYERARFNAKLLRNRMGRTSKGNLASTATGRFHKN